MNNDRMTRIIAADYMYLIFIGSEKTIDGMINKLNTSRKHSNNIKKNNDIKSTYIKCDIGNPCIEILEESTIQKMLIDDAIENIRKLKNNISPRNISPDEIDIYKKYIILDEGIETAQCLTYADIVSNDAIISKRINSNLFMIMTIKENDTYYTLSFPILQLDEEENPDKLISTWLSEHTISTDDFKSISIKPVHIVGKEHDILVFSALVDE